MLLFNTGVSTFDDTKIISVGNNVSINNMIALNKALATNDHIKGSKHDPWGHPLHKIYQSMPTDKENPISLFEM